MWASSVFFQMEYTCVEKLFDMLENLHERLELLRNIINTQYSLSMEFRALSALVAIATTPRLHILLLLSNGMRKRKLPRLQG